MIRRHGSWSAPLFYFGTCPSKFNRLIYDVNSISWVKSSLLCHGTLARCYWSVGYPENTWLWVSHSMGILADCSFSFGLLILLIYVFISSCVHLPREKKSHSIVQNSLELTVSPRLSLNSQKSSSLGSGEGLDYKQVSGQSDQGGLALHSVKISLWWNCSPHPLCISIWKLDSSWSLLCITIPTLDPPQ